MAANQPLASQVSAPNPFSGQKNRSSKNFQFLEVPADGAIHVSMPDSITCVIMEDKGIDPIIVSIENGASFPASLVKTERNYYFATPNGTLTNFAVTLSGEV